MAYGDVSVTEGTGKDVAVDTIDSQEFQRFKPAFGTEGNAVDVSATDPLPVVLTPATVTISDGGNVITVDGLVTVSDGGGAITVDGTVAVSSVSGTVAVTGTVTANAGTGTHLVLPAVSVIRADTGDVTAGVLTLGAAEKTIGTANTDRTGLILQHVGTGTVYVNFAAGATASVRRLQLEPGAYWEMPFKHVGVVSCYGGSGSLLVTDLEAG